MDEIKQFIEQNFFDWGPNKRQEIERLIFENLKREHIVLDNLIVDMPEIPCRYQTLKTYLLKRRYPRLDKDVLKEKVLLPEVKINLEEKVCRRDKLMIDPKYLYIEKNVFQSDLALRFRTSFPQAQIQEISSYKDFIQNKEYDLKSFNQRTEQFFIVNEQNDFYLPCPCTPGAVCCDYGIMNLGVGCAFDCQYCYMQAYINSPGMIFPANLNQYLEKFDALNKKNRLGTGQFTDSLIFDPWTKYSIELIKFFKQRQHIQFELKTKSANVENVLSIEGTENIVIAWSLNPQEIIDEVEWYAASLEERLKAASQCIERGYSVAFHFDPIFYSNDWQEKYQAVVDRLFEMIDPQKIRWISLGGFRMTSKLKQSMESRFPENTILDEEFVLGYDEKLRYPFTVRKEIYSHMKRWIHKYDQNVNVYLCMEAPQMAKECGLGIEREGEVNFVF